MSPLGRNRIDLLGRLLLAGLVGSLALARLVFAQAALTVGVDPVTTTIAVDQIVTVSIEIENVTNLGSAEIHLAFNPNVLEVIDADQAQAGVQIANGGMLIADFVGQNTTDNALGTIDFSVAQIGRPGVNGNGTLAIISFKGITVGTSPVTFRRIQSSPAGVNLLDSDGRPIITPTDADTTQPGSVTVTGGPSVTLTPTSIPGGPTLTPTVTPPSPAPTATPVEPTLRPTNAPVGPTPRRAPVTVVATPITKTPIEIAMLNTYDEVQADGTIKNIAELSMDVLDVGTLELTAPLTLTLNESNIVQLIIIPNSALVDLPKVAISPLSASGPDNAFKFSDQIQIYPIMIAELTGLNFKIFPEGEIWRTVASSQEVEWIWGVIPTSPGRQILVVKVSIPVIVDQKKDAPNVLKDIPIFVEVMPPPIPTSTLVPTDTPIPTLPPTPTLTPTPPALAQVEEGIIRNISTIITACIGLVGVLTTAYVTYLINQRRTGDAKSKLNGKSNKRKKK